MSYIYTEDVTLVNDIDCFLPADLIQIADWVSN